jgi:hypothetical protein
MTRGKEQRGSQPDNAGLHHVAGAIKKRVDGGVGFGAQSSPREGACARVNPARATSA